LNLTLAVFNVPVLWNTTNISSESNVVGIMINIPWETFDSHHLVVRGIIETGLSFRSIGSGKDNSSLFSFSGINSQFWIGSILNGPVFIIEEPLLIFIVSLEVLNSKSSNTINWNSGQNEI
jgi:hypothetical protein